MVLPLPLPAEMMTARAESTTTAAPTANAARAQTIRRHHAAGCETRKSHGVDLHAQSIRNDGSPALTKFPVNSGVRRNPFFPERWSADVSSCGRQHEL